MTRYLEAVFLCLRLRFFLGDLNQGIRICLSLLTKQNGGTLPTSFLGGLRILGENRRPANNSGLRPEFAKMIRGMQL